MENTVDMMTQVSVPDDAAQAQAQPLEAIAYEQPTQQAQPEAPKSEPGWIKGRIHAAVEKAVAEAEARMAAKYEQEMAPMRDVWYDNQAQQLVASGEFKTLETAKEYVRLKNGAIHTAEAEPAQEPKALPARDEQGRFAKAEDPVARARGELLASQAGKIQTAYGIDVMQAFNDDLDVRQKVISGEWDFYDVAQHMRAPQRSMPAPMRSPNGGMGGRISVSGMSDEQFRKLQSSLSSGAAYDMR